MNLPHHPHKHSSFGSPLPGEPLIQTQTRTPLGSRTRSSRTNCAKRLNTALGTNSDPVPAKLQTGHRAELAFGGTQIDLHSSVVMVKKSCKCELAAFVAALTPRLLRSPGKSHEYGD